MRRWGSLGAILEAIAILYIYIYIYIYIYGVYLDVYIDMDKNTYIK